jgi:hypothetical protein
LRALPGSVRLPGDGPTAASSRCRQFAPDLAHSTDQFEEELFRQLADLEGQSFRFHARNRLIAWAAKVPREARSVLDVGTGTGFVLAGLGARFPNMRLVGGELLLGGLDVASPGGGAAADRRAPDSLRRVVRRCGCLRRRRAHRRGRARPLAARTGCPAWWGRARHGSIAPLALGAARPVLTSSSALHALGAQGQADERGGCESSASRRSCPRFSPGWSRRDFSPVAMRRSSPNVSIAQLG